LQTEAGRVKWLGDGTPDAVTGLSDIVQVPHLPDAMAEYLGLGAACCISMASADMLISFKAAKLRVKAVARVCVFGGHRGKGQGPHEPLSDAAWFDPVSGAWSCLPDMPKARIHCAAAATSGYIYVLGGHDGGVEERGLKAAERFNICTGGWERLPPMLFGRQKLAAAAVAGSICVAGGIGELEAVAGAERFDPDTKSWEPLPSLPSPRSRCAAAGLSGAVYIVGGADAGYRCLKTVERLVISPGAGSSWEAMPPMLVARSGCAAVAYARSGLFVAGGSLDGWAPLETVEHFDPAKGQWKLTACMEKPRRDFAAALLSVGTPAIYVLGGLSYAGRPTPSLEILDLTNREDGWIHAPGMPAKASCCAAAAVWW